MNEDGVRVPNCKIITLEDVDMASENAPTKEEFVEALRNKGINNLEDLVNVIWPETGGYAWYDDVDEGIGLGLVTILGKGSFNLKWDNLDARGFGPPDE